MPRFPLLLAALALAISAAPALAADTAPAKAELKNAEGKTVGTATLTELPGGVRLHLAVEGLPPGPKAFHIHENGACEAPGFSSAGGHFNPGAHAHGWHDAKGPHAGDMPNVIVGADGRGEVEVVNERVRLDDGERGLFKKGGTAIVMHAGADDYASQPAGNAGGRIACGVIER